MKKSNKQPWIEKKKWRVCILVGTAVLGAGLWWFFHSHIRDFSGEKQQYVTSWMEIFTLSFPVLLALWWFRTYDTQQQIAKSKEQVDKSQDQIQQSSFVSGLENLLKPDSLSASIGVQLLIQISDSTHIFDENIRLAFIKRIQKLPETDVPILDRSYGYSIADPEVNYLPHIFEWIVDYTERNGEYMNNKFINVPEMKFRITELESTADFFSPKKSPKQIPLVDIKRMMDDYRNK